LKNLSPTKNPGPILKSPLCEKRGRKKVWNFPADPWEEFKRAKTLPNGKLVKNSYTDPFWKNFKKVKNAFPKKFKPVSTRFPPVGKN